MSFDGFDQHETSILHTLHPLTLRRGRLQISSFYQQLFGLEAFCLPVHFDRFPPLTEECKISQKRQSSSIFPGQYFPE